MDLFIGNEKLKPGQTKKVPCLAFEDYLAATGLNHSSLKKCNSYQEFLAEEKEESTAAMQLGSLIHDIILLPKLFDGEYSKYATCPSFGLKKADKEAKKQFLEQNSHKMIVDQSDLDLAVKIKNKILLHPIVSEILNHSEKEVSFFSCNEDESVFKCRFDAIYYGSNHSDSIPVEIKTCNTFAFENLELEVFKRKYHSAAAFYIDILNSYKRPNSTNDFVFIFVETQGLHRISVRSLDDFSIDQGRKCYKRLLNNLEKYKKLKSENFLFCKEEEQISSIGIPRFKKQE